MRRLFIPPCLDPLSHTTAAWAGLAKKPHDRARAIRPSVKELKGKLISMYLAFGAYDVVGIDEFPDNESEAAFSISASAGGAIKAIKTTPLMTVQEGMRAMRKAGRSGYKPPA